MSYKFYLTSYEIERPLCLEGLPSLIRIHEELGVPATLYVTGRILLDYPQTFLSLAGRKLFDIQSHTFSHRHDPLNQTAQWEADLKNCVQAFVRILGTEPMGIRLSEGLYSGLSSYPILVHILVDSGYQFVSSDFKGPRDTIPAPLTEPYFYSFAGDSTLLEIPANDWPDSALCQCPYPAAVNRRCLVGWPPVLPTGLPSRMPSNANEAAEVYLRTLDYISESSLRFYSPIFHAWFLQSFDPEMTCVRSLIRHAINRGFKFQTCESICRDLANTLGQKASRESNRTIAIPQKEGL